MIIEKLETKIKLAGFISFISILASCIIAISSFFMATIMVREERKKIYVLDGDVPLSATHTPQEINIEIEAKLISNLFIAISLRYHLMMSI